MSANYWLTSFIVTVTYIGVALGYFPKLRANRATIAIMGAGLLILTRQVDFNHLSDFLDLDTLILLFSMMIINANLQLSGFFRLAGAAVLKLTRTPRAFLAVEILMAGFLSAFFLNDTICLMFTPLLLDLTLSLGLNPIPYLIALATAANIGSTATLTGNPQNMIIGVASGISYTQFALGLAPVALLGLLAVWGILVLAYRDDLTNQPFKQIPALNPRIYRPLLLKCLLTVVGLLAAFLAGVPIAEAAFIAACALLFTRRIRPEKVFAEIDWGLLVFFAALFIVTGSLETNGVSSRLFSAARLDSNLNLWSLTGVTVALSNLVSNVPAVMLLRPVVAGLANPTGGWLTLAAASTLAGNLTLLGSVANLIVAEIAMRRQIKLSFWEYTRVGVVITLVSLVIAVVWLRLFVWPVG